MRADELARLEAPSPAAPARIPRAKHDLPLDAAAAVAHLISASGSAARHGERVLIALAGDDTILHEILIDLSDAIFSGALADVGFDSVRFVDVIGPHLHPAPPAHDEMYRRCIVELVDREVVGSMAKRFASLGLETSLPPRTRAAAALAAYMFELELSADELRPDANPALEVVFRAQLAAVLDAASGVEQQVNELAESVRAGRVSVADLSDLLPGGHSAELYARLMGQQGIDQDEVMTWAETALSGEHVPAVLSSDQAVATTAVVSAAATGTSGAADLLGQLIDDDFLDEVHERLERQCQEPGASEVQRRAALQLRVALDTVPLWLVFMSLQQGAPVETLDGDAAFVDGLDKLEPPWSSADLEPYQAFLAGRGEAIAAARIARARELLEGLRESNAGPARGSGDAHRTD